MLVLTGLMRERGHHANSEPRQQMILFLDFDGVLHPLDRPNGLFTLVPEFERLMRRYPAVGIVISSSWREGYKLEQLRAIFSDDIAGRIIGLTPVLQPCSHAHVREAEILLWLRSNGRVSEEWVAVDDCALLFSPGCRNLVLVDGETGFSALTELELRTKFARKWK